MRFKVLIPVYKSPKELNRFEKLSIQNTTDRLAKSHEIVFIGPKKVQDTYLLTYPHIDFVNFPSRYFDGIKGYNKLLKSIRFYRRFSNFDFILIAQTDALVFGNVNDLLLFDKFDYYGAPSINQGVATGYNGGFSLRNVKNSINVLRSYKRSESWNEIVKRHFHEPSRYLLIWKWFSVLLDYFVRKIVASPFNRFEKGNEDIFWSVDVPKAVPSFKVNDFETALKFSWENKCAEFYNKYPLPFGCHGWWNYNYDFWKDIIKIDERQDAN
jgi:hypothetical protein